MQVEYSIQFKLICIAPNHIIHYLKALNIEGLDLKMYRETQQFPQLAALWRLWREKNSSRTRLNVGGHLPRLVGVSKEKW